MKKLILALPFLLFFLPAKIYAITPNQVIVPPAVQTKLLAPISSQEWTHYTQAQIDQMTQGAFHPYILRTLIRCESQNTNISRLDSNGKMSYGILQFNGTATWNTFAPLAGVSSSPMNPVAAIKVADYMISIGQLHRWSCAKITGLIK